MAIQALSQERLSDVRQRFEAKYLPEPNSGCWLWEGAVDNAGYGDFCVSGRGSHRRAHIVSWLLEGNSIPDRHNVLHRCNNKGCVNPKHLYTGTQSQNAADSLRAGNLHYDPSKAKIAGKPELRAEIRSLYLSGGYSQQALARKFGMSQVSVHRAIKTAPRKD